jgi:hypothetical protein
MKYTLLLLILSACGTTGAQGPPGTSPTTSLTTIQTMVANQNAYREAVGQEPLTPGLTCTAYSISPLTTCLVQTVPASCVTWTTNSYTNLGSYQWLGMFDSVESTSAVNFLPVALQTYTSWYEISCTGSLVVADNNYHLWDMNSDDGSLFYVDGTLVVNNDGIHNIQDKRGEKFLQYGFHSIQLNYFEATGNQGLTLNEDGSVMSNLGFYH